MSKAVIWFLIILGLFFVIAGIFSKTLLLIGLTLIGSGLYFGVGPDGILRKDQVLDTWAALIENGQTKAEEVLCGTESFMNLSNVPDILMERQDIAPGLISGISGKTREFLVVTDKESYPLRFFKIYINARDYGNNLDVSWHLTYKPSLWQSIAALLPFISLVPLKISDLDLFDEMDLRAYTANVHHCFLKAVVKLMLDLNQDPSKLDRKSKGFLGISG